MQSKLMSKKSSKSSLIGGLSFTWQKHVWAETSESNGYSDICLPSLSHGVVGQLYDGGRDW
jgi:hypothetical protein